VRLDLTTHPLFAFWKKVRGNAKPVVMTEPMWGIPFNLVTPYASVYMVALGLNDRQIGLVASIGLAFQIFFALMSGIITDKLGRKRATLISDIVSWGIPTLIWAISQNFTYFVVAVIFNAAWRVAHTSWTCLLVEDTDQDLLLDVFSWIYIAAVASAFVSPISGLLIAHFGLIPAVRGLYLFASGMMTTKALVMNALVGETRRGAIRMQETRHQSVFEMLREYRGVIGLVFKSKETLYTLAIMVMLNIVNTVNGSFWAIYVTSKLNIPPAGLSIYPFVRSITMLVFFFGVMPRLREMHFRNPMLFGLAGLLLSQVLLISIPANAAYLLYFVVIIDAFSVATFSPMVDRMLVLTVNEVERARIMAVIYVIVISFTSPFGWIAGELSSINRVLPFILNISLWVVCAVLVFLAARHNKKVVAEAAAG
jgi:MFS family permease